MEFKDRLKKLRAEKGTSATQLAHHLDKGESAVRMWESGRNKPDADTLIAMSIYFDCSTDFLLGRSYNRKEKPNEHLEEGMEKVPFNRNDHEIQEILADEQFCSHVADLLKALKKNKKTGGTTDLYSLFDVLLKDRTEDKNGNVFRVWKNELEHIGLIVGGLLILEKMGEGKRVVQVKEQIRDLIHAAYHCHRLNDSPPDEQCKYPDI